MTNLRAALRVLNEALVAHLEAALVAGDDDDAVTAAAIDLGEAFDAYDEALFRATGYDTPLVFVDEDDEDGDLDEDDLEDEIADDFDDEEDDGDLDEDEDDDDVDDEEY